MSAKNNHPDTFTCDKREKYCLCRIVKHAIMYLVPLNTTIRK